MGTINKKKFWCVWDATIHSTMQDVMFQTDLDELGNIILGSARDWHRRNPKFYLRREDAVADARKRMALAEPRNCREAADVFMNYARFADSVEECKRFQIMAHVLREFGETPVPRSIVDEYGWVEPDRYSSEDY